MPGAESPHSSHEQVGRFPTKKRQGVEPPKKFNSLPRPCFLCRLNRTLYLPSDCRNPDHVSLFVGFGHWRRRWGASLDRGGTASGFASSIPAIPRLTTFKFPRHDTFLAFIGHFLESIDPSNSGTQGSLRAFLGTLATIAPRLAAIGLTMTITTGCCSALVRA